VPIQCIAHVGICVSDLERSRRFYRDALGFKEVARLQTSSPPTRQLLQMKQVDLHALFLERDGLRIELLYYPTPGCTAGERPRPMNQLGLTHLAIRVDDLDATIAALARAGARPIEGTAIDNPEFQARAAMVLDPDGMRLELIQAPIDPRAPLGEPL
jgi:catechol 2,3-dioxygenase-like lactoylglutathione lyase family enzyme